MASPLSKMVRHAMRMMVGTFASRILGLLREIITAALFGATRQLDAFFVAYTLANLSRQLLAEGALSAAFVPVFSKVVAEDGREKAARLARQMITVLLVAGGAVVAIGLLGAPLLVRLMAPGFSGEDARLAVALTRLMFPFLLLVSVAALAMGVLNTLDSYFIPAVAPALSNLLYIVLLAILAPRLGVWALPAAVLMGGAAQMLLQWWRAKALGMPLVPARPDWKDPELKKVICLFFPYMAGLSLNQVNPVISRMLGSFLEGGTISVLSYADRVIQLPLGLFVIAISQAVLPMLSRLGSDETAGFALMIRDALRFTLFVILPVVVGITLLARPMVHLLFVRGAFNEWAWEATSRALALYALGLPGMACSTVVMRGLYARRLPREALKVTGFTVLLNLVFCLALVRAFSYAGLALASSLAFSGGALMGAWTLRRHLGTPIQVLTRKWVVPHGAALAIMAAVILAGSLLFPYDPAFRLWVKLAWVFAAVAAGGVVYGFASWVTGCSEWKWVFGAFEKEEKSV